MTLGDASIDGKGIDGATVDSPGSHPIRKKSPQKSLATQVDAEITLSLISDFIRELGDYGSREPGSEDKTSSDKVAKGTVRQGGAPNKATCDATAGGPSATQMRVQATEFLKAHSDLAQKLLHTKDEATGILTALKGIGRTVSDARIAHSSTRDGATFERTIAQVTPQLDEIRRHLGRSPPKASAGPQSADHLSKEVGGLQTSAQRRIDESTQGFSSLVNSFVNSVQQRITVEREARVLSSAIEKLTHSSTYYPRHCSPEARALRDGLFRVSGDAQALKGVISSYLRAEEQASKLSRSSSIDELRLGAETQLADESFFNRLVFLKATLQAAPKLTRVQALQALRDGYSYSGNASLAYFAAHDCIVEGDWSHQAFFVAAQRARSAGHLEDLYAGVQKLAEFELSATVLLHAYQTAVELKDQSSAGTYFNTLCIMYGRSAECSIAKAREQMAAKAPLEAELHALSAYAKAKRDPNLDSLAIAALELAIQSNLERRGEASDRELLAHKILKRNNENPVGWEYLLRTKLPQSGTPANGWEPIEKLLREYRGETGCLCAAAHALRIGDVSRAKTFFAQALMLNPRGVEGLLGLAALAEANGQVDQARAYHRRVADRAPHHREVRIFSFPDDPVHETKEEALKPLVPAAWTQEVRDQILVARTRARGKVGVPFHLILKDVSPEYCNAYELLAPQSTLFEAQHRAVLQLRGYAEIVRAFLAKDRISVSEWRMQAGSLPIGIYHGVDPHNPLVSVGQFTNCLQELERIVSDFDPVGAYFSSPTRHHEIIALAASVRSAYYSCAHRMTTTANSQTSQRFNSNDDQAELRSALSTLVRSLETFETGLVESIGPQVIHSAELLKSWTLAVEALPAESLSEIRKGSVSAKDVSLACESSDPGSEPGESGW